LAIHARDGLVDRVMRAVLMPAALAVAVVVALPSAAAAPSADDGGYLNSTARCTPDAVVVFGSTDASRIAICKASNGRFEYRGVRLSDGAKLIVPAEGSGDDSFVADNGAVSYRVSAKSLVVSEGGRVVREEPMVDFHGQKAVAPPPQATPSPTPTPTTPLPPPLPAERGGGQG
jgi:hypothetical protein